MGSLHVGARRVRFCHIDRPIALTRTHFSQLVHVAQTSVQAHMGWREQPASWALSARPTCYTFEGSWAILAITPNAARHVQSSFDCHLAMLFILGPLPREGRCGAGH